MDYIKHYNILCDRAKDRTILGYTEKHHILPRCLGGTDDVSNLVRLTPEEHYVAHQLLVKIYPNNPSLIFAAFRMTSGGEQHGRENKAYGWLKRKHVKVCAETRTGPNNPSWGKRWYYDPVSLNSKLMTEADVPTGWIPGRVQNPEKRFARKALLERRKNLRRQKSEDRARRLFHSYMQGEYNSLSEFVNAGMWGKSHEALRQLWVRYIPEYREYSSQGVPFSKSAGKVFTDTHQSSKLK